MVANDRQGSAGGPAFSGEIVARLLGITPRRLQQLAKEGVIPKAGRGQYPLAPVVRAYIQYVQNGSAAPEDVDPERMEPFKRRAYYQGEMERLRLKEQAGELIPRLQYEAEAARVVKIMTHFLETLPDILERDCGLAAPVLAKIEERIDQARIDLHDAIGATDPRTAEQASA